MARRFDNRPQVFSPEGRLYSMSQGQAGNFRGIMSPDRMMIARDSLIRKQAPMSFDPKFMMDPSKKTMEAYRRDRLSTLKYLRLMHECLGTVYINMVEHTTFPPNLECEINELEVQVKIDRANECVQQQVLPPYHVYSMGQGTPQMRTQNATRVDRTYERVQQQPQQITAFPGYTLAPGSGPVRSPIVKADRSNERSQQPNFPGYSLGPGQIRAQNARVENGYDRQQQYFGFPGYSLTPGGGPIRSPAVKASNERSQQQNFPGYSLGSGSGPIRTRYLSEKNSKIYSYPIGNGSSSTIRVYNNVQSQPHFGQMK